MALNGTSSPDLLLARFDGDLVYGLGGRDVLTNYDAASFRSYNNTYLDGGDDNDRLTSYFDLANAPNLPRAVMRGQLEHLRSFSQRPAALEMIRFWRPSPGSNLQLTKNFTR